MTTSNDTSGTSLRQRQSKTQLQPVQSKPVQSANGKKSTMTQNKKDLQRGNHYSQRRAEKEGRSSFLGNYSAIFIVLQMIFCVTGIYVCFGVWSIKQERVITKPYHSYANGPGKEVKSEKLSTVFVISLAQAIAGIFGGCVLLFVETFFSRNKRHASPVRFFAFPRLRLAALRLPALMGFTNAFGSTFGYAAMRRLPYPVVLATKMSKMVPVMLVGFLWYGTRYSMSKCLACAAITCGIMCFYVLEEKHHPHAEPTPKTPNSPTATGWVGFVLLFINLVADGFTNSTQDVLVKRRGWSGNRLMLWTNLSSALWLAAALLLLEAAHPLASGFIAAETYAETIAPPSLLPLLEPLERAARWVMRDMLPLQDLSRTWRFFQQYPEALSDVVVLSLLNAVGQFFIFRTISLFGTLTLTAMTLLRKSGSVVLSIIVHGHHVAAGQWVSLIIVFGGALCEAVMHVKDKSHAHVHKSTQAHDKKESKSSSP